MNRIVLFICSLLILVLVLNGCSTEPTWPAPIEPAEKPASQPAPSPAVEAPVYSELDGAWEGKLNVAGLELAITVHFRQVADEMTATIDIPQQGAAGIPVHDIEIDLPALRFEMLEGAQLATFEGELTDAGDIAGRFSQSGAEGSFELMRPGAADAQRPYSEEEVSFVNGDVILAGTLSIPAGSGPFPSLIMISGSGAQTRDGTIPIAPGYRLFADLADYLTRNGVAVLRYDDRGVGLSTGDRELATSTDFAADAEAGFVYLQSRPELAPKQIGLLGHSEGANIAAMIAAGNPHVFATVALAGSAVDGYDIILSQLERILLASGGAEQEVEAAIAQQRQVLDLVRTNDRESLEELISNIIRQRIDALSADEVAAIPNVDALVEEQVAAEVDVLLSPWYREFIDANPADDWAAVQTPVLALFGELDVQVDARLNRAELEDALAASGNDRATILVLPTANHLFQDAATGTLEEYGELGNRYAPDLFETISVWLQDRLAERNGS